MKKIRLNLDDLQVQSFSTTDAETMRALSCDTPTGNSTSNDCPPEQYWTQYCGTSDTCNAYCMSGIGEGCGLNSQGQIGCSQDPGFNCYGTDLVACNTQLTGGCTG